jgi:uncharacterized membrane protein YhaH (DUF805 family)
MDIGARVRMMKEVMSPRRAIRSGFANYANFDGRAGRAEFWWWNLFAFGAGYLVYLVLVLGLGERSIELASGVSLVVMLSLAIPSLAVALRRLHDLGNSGWWVLVAAVPVMDLLLLVRLSQKGNVGGNSYGQDPLEAGLGEIAINVDVEVAAASPEEPEGPIPSEGPPQRLEGSRIVPRGWRPAALLITGALIGAAVFGITALAWNSWAGHPATAAARASHIDALSIIRALDANGIGCDPSWTWRNSTMSWVTCKADGGGTFEVQFSPSYRGIVLCTDARDYGDPFLVGDGWVVIPSTTSSGGQASAQNPLYFPALAPPRALKEALGGELIAASVNCSAA